ncbi:MarR family winged helix-turn-helix transcriptional regulator [Chloroflexota bacterium]
MVQKVSGVDDVFKLWWLIARTRDALHRARVKELRRFNISTSEAVVLFLIPVLGKKATIGQISHLSFRAFHSVSGLINRMEKDGLVRKVQDLNKRSSRIVMAPKGRKAYRSSLERVSMHNILSSLSTEEQRQLTSMMHKLHSRALKELEIKSELPWT